MKTSRARYSKIQRLVQVLLSKHGIVAPPVPIYDIARSEGAVIEIKQFNNEVSGLLLRTEHRTIIAVEKRQSPTRQRFTVAHELGHLLLHAGEELHVDTQFRVNLRSPESSTAQDVEEIESNAFAASLLMPEHFIQNEMAEFILDIDDARQVQTLAKRYEVSAQAMTIRLLNLMTLGKI